MDVLLVNVCVTVLDVFMPSETVSLGIKSSIHLMLTCFTEESFFLLLVPPLLPHS